MTEQVFEAITAAIANSAWGTVEPSYVPALARDIMYDLERTRFAVVQLPEPDEHNEWFGTDWTVWISRGGSMQVRSPGYMSHPIKARQFAAALLAASLAVSGAEK